MLDIRVWGTAVATIAVLALPFVGGGGPGLTSTAHAQSITTPSAPTSTCPSYVPGAPTAAVGDTESPQGVGGTTRDDLISFAIGYNQQRVANCLQPIPWANFTWSACMEQRLFWMAEDPSTDPTSAWGHLGTVRSDGVPSVGCDGNLAGGMSNTGETVATKWWNSPKHRESLYRPEDSIMGACIAFAMTHGGVPDESADFTRAAARWYDC